jgi:hypothetical protein
MVIKRPEKKETLAIKREERIRRQSALRKRLARFTPRGWVEIGEAGALFFLFLINFLMLRPFFGKEDIANVFSAPVIPILANLTSWIVPHSYGIRFWLLVFFALFPVTFYFFVREVSKRKLVAFFSGLIACLPVGIFLPLRIEFGILSQDGAHMASLTIIPLVCYLLLRFLRNGNFWQGFLTALGTVLVALTSPVGLLVLFVFMAVMTFSEMLLGRGRLKFLRFLTVVFLAAGFSAFWYNPKFFILMANSPQGELVKKTVGNLLPVSFFVLPVLGVGGFLFFENRPQFQPMFIAFFLSVAFGLFSLGAGVVHPLPSRFVPALGISVAFLTGFLIVWFFDFLRLSSRIEKFKKLASNRQLAAFGLIFLFFILTISTYVLKSKNLVALSDVRVLGLSEDKTVGIWEIRQNTTFFESLIGYGMTSLTFLSVAVLRNNLKRAREGLKQEEKARN